jgi:CRP-like cAMP-binding protein
MGHPQDVIDTLKLVRPLAGLSAEWLETLSRAARLQSLRQGECAAEQGRALSHMLIIHDGELELSITGRSGRRRVIARLGRGQTFGLMAAFDTQPVLCTSRACCDSTVIRVPREALIDAILANGNFALDLFMDLSGRARLLYRFLDAQATLTPLGRVANLLLSLMAFRGPLSDASDMVELRFSQADIADMMGITRQSLGTQLKALQAMGAISLQYRSVRILDVPALQALTAR